MSVWVSIKGEKKKCKFGRRKPGDLKRYDILEELESRRKKGHPVKFKRGWSVAELCTVLAEDDARISRLRASKPVKILKPTPELIVPQEVKDKLGGKLERPIKVLIDTHSSFQIREPGDIFTSLGNEILFSKEFISQLVILGNMKIRTISGDLVVIVPTTHSNQMMFVYSLRQKAIVASVEFPNDIEIPLVVSPEEIFTSTMGGRGIWAGWYLWNRLSSAPPFYSSWRDVGVKEIPRRYILHPWNPGMVIGFSAKSLVFIDVEEKKVVETPIALPGPPATDLLGYPEINSINVLVPLGGKRMLALGSRILLLTFGDFPYTEFSSKLVLGQRQLIQMQSISYREIEDCVSLTPNKFLTMSAQSLNLFLLNEVKLVHIDIELGKGGLGAWGNGKLIDYKENRTVCYQQAVHLRNLYFIGYDLLEVPKFASSIKIASDQMSVISTDKDIIDVTDYPFSQEYSEAVKLVGKYLENWINPPLGTFVVAKFLL